jgi:hypothetical protein
MMGGRLLNLFGTPVVLITDGVLSVALDGRAPGWRPLWTGGDGHAPSVDRSTRWSALLSPPGN